MELQSKYLSRGIENCIELCLLLAMAIGGILASVNMLWLFPSTIPALLLLVAYCTLFSKKRMRVVFGIIALLAELVLGIVIRSTIAAWIKVLANVIFDKSASTQAYHYDMFKVQEITDWQYLAATMWGSCAVIAVCILISAASVRLCGIVVLTGVILYSTFFGIKIPIQWMTGLILAVALTTIVKTDKINIRPILVLAMGCAVMFMAAYAFFPEENAVVSEWDEHARDVLAIEKAYYAAEEAPDIQRIEQQKEQENNSTDSGFNIFNYKFEFMFGEKTVLIIIAAVLMLIMFSGAIYSDLVRRRGMKERAGIEDENAAKAIHHMFLYSVEWEKILGEDKMSEELRSKKNEMKTIWLEATYSEHAMSENARAQMYSYLKLVEEHIWKQATRRQRLFIKYRRGLIIEEANY